MASLPKLYNVTFTYILRSILNVNISKKVRAIVKMRAITLKRFIFAIEWHHCKVVLHDLDLNVHKVRNSFQ